MQNKSGATAVYLNGNIYTVDNNFSVAEAMVVKNKYLLYVGTNEVAKKFIDDDTEVIDLEGKTVLPGLLEGHTHFGWLSQSLIEVDGLFKEKKQILEEIKERAEKAEPGEWILGRGWNNEIWEDTAFPTREELDEVSPDNPVCMIRTCCHAYWANSKALELAGIDRNTENPAGGEIIRTESGDPWGVLVDTAGDKLMEVVPPYRGEKQMEALRAGQKYLLSFGFTGVMDAGATVDEIDAMKKMGEDEELDIRIYAYAKEGESAQHYYKNGMIIGAYDDHLTVRGVKLFADGSTGARSANLLEDYADRPGHRGNSRYTDEDLLETIREARLNGFQISTHVNGDGSVEQVLNAYMKVLDEMPLEDNRWRLEHYQLITYKQLQKAVEYKFIPSMQFVQCTTDKPMMEERVGVDSGRLERAYLWRDILDAGLHIANGSDAPVELVNPYHGFYAGVTRKARDGAWEGAWYPSQCITRQEALKAATIWVAEAQFEENIKGSLEAGKFADFVVIDKDYMNCKEEDIKEIKALMTVIGGKKVYEAE